MSSGRLLERCGSLRSGLVKAMLMREAAEAFDAAEFTEADLRFPLYDVTWRMRRPYLRPRKRWPASRRDCSACAWFWGRKSWSARPMRSSLMES